MITLPGFRSRDYATRITQPGLRYQNYAAGITLPGFHCQDSTANVVWGLALGSFSFGFSLAPSFNAGRGAQTVVQFTDSMSTYRFSAKPARQPQSRPLSQPSRASLASQPSRSAWEPSHPASPATPGVRRSAVDPSVAAAMGIDTCDCRINFAFCELQVRLAGIRESKTL